MAGRKSGKHVKKREDYTTTELTSDDVMYTTESVGVTPYDTGTSRLIDSFTSGGDSRRYDSGDPRTYDWYTNDDQDTSFVSYQEEKRNKKYLISSESQNRQDSGRQSPRRHSPGYHSSSDTYGYFIDDESADRKRNKHGRSPERDIHYSTRHEAIAGDSSGKRRRKEDYSEEKDLDYPLRTKKNKHGNSEFQTIYEEFEERSGKKSRFRATGRKKDYQVYAYQEPIEHDVFINKTGGNKATLKSPEVEMNTYEYPVLAFKVVSPKENALDKDSGTIYLPVLEVNKKTKTYKTVPYHQRRSNEKGNQKEMGHLQVYAANLNNQQNIFQAYSEGSDQKTQTDNVNKVAKASKINTENKPNISEFDFSGSLPYSLLADIAFDTEQTIDNNKSPQKDEMMMGNKDIVNYQINVDIDKRNIFEDNTSKGSTRKSTVTRKSNAIAGLEFKQIFEDPNHDDFPVTKNYIKVNNNGSAKIQPQESVRKSVAGSTARSLLNPFNKEDSKQFSQPGDNQSTSDGSVIKSKFSVLYGEPIKGLSLNQTKHTDQGMLPVEGSVLETKKSQIVKQSSIGQSVASKTSTLDERKSIAPLLRKSLVNVSKDKNTSGDNLNKGTVSQENRLSARGESGLAADHINYLDPKTKLNQSVTQENNQRLSTVTDRKSVVKSMELQDDWHASIPARGSSISNERQTLKENQVTSGLEERKRKSLRDPNKFSITKENLKSNAENSMNPEKQKTPSNKVIKDSMKLSTASLLMANKFKPNNRAHSSKKSNELQSIFEGPSRKSKVEGRHSMHNVEPMTNLHTQEDQMCPKVSATNLLAANRSQITLAQTKGMTELRGSGEKLNKSILSRKLSRNKSKDKSMNSKSRLSFWNVFRKKDKNLTEETYTQNNRISTLYPQNDFYTLYTEPTEETVPKDTVEVKTEKSCDCVSKYIIQFRECIHFFLGTSLHEQVMNILKTM